LRIEPEAIIAARRPQASRKAASQHRCNNTVSPSAGDVRKGIFAWSRMTKFDFGLHLSAPAEINPSYHLVLFASEVQRPVPHKTFNF
jgi:hypothetical protein